VLSVRIEYRESIVSTFAVILLFTAATVRYAHGWESVEMTGDIPTNRYGHTVTKIGDDHYIFGGTTSSGISNELFRLQGNHFTKVATTGTVPGMYGHNAFYNGTRMIIVGGSRDSSNNSVHVIDPTVSNPTWETKGEQLFPPRKEAASILVGDKVIVSGGRSPDEQTVFPLSDSRA